jgi:hypothetical protein
MLISALLMAAAVMADPPSAASAPPASPVAEAKAAPAKPAKTEKPRLICRTEAVTGSLMPKKTCYSEDQAAQRRQDERENLERIQQNSH